MLFKIQQKNNSILFILISFDLSFEIVNKKTSTSQSTSAAPADRKYYVNYNGLPLSADGVVLLVMTLQLALFYYFSKKEFGREE